MTDICKVYKYNKWRKKSNLTKKITDVLVVGSGPYELGRLSEERKTTRRKDGVVGDDHDIRYRLC
jgi:hypothetical protein